MLCMCIGYTMSNPSAAGRREREFLDSRRAVLPSIFSLSFLISNVNIFEKKKPPSSSSSFFLSLHHKFNTFRWRPTERKKNPHRIDKYLRNSFFFSPFVRSSLPFSSFSFLFIFKKFLPHT